MKKGVFVKVILFLLPPCIVISCNGNKKEQMETTADSRPENAEIRLSFSSMSPSGTTCFLKYSREKADTLFIHKMSKEVFKQELSPEISDSIFFKSERILNDFPYSKNKQLILDGLSVQLSVSINNSVRSGYWGSLSSIKELPEEVQQMIQFINQQIPKEQALQ